MSTPEPQASALSQLRRKIERLGTTSGRGRQFDSHADTVCMESYVGAFVVDPDTIKSKSHISREIYFLGLLKKTHRLRI
jgi:hypothetical protein